ncbi:hypothetical protein THRCLA_22909 [Thraustotheca clavata]|uniref:BRCT domain-containing protein n=1 Tax=Thraustotheca clavata TaxID=74557 RepID=A0A1V9YPU1_9STRA|nr:hypothetical protein THRCLA_22909 [Thraustotheca clavata]
MDRLFSTVLQRNRTFDPSCTHVTCKEFRRTEKIIAACASGKWILMPQYSTDSRKKGMYLDQEPYEWGLNKVSKKISMDPRTIAIFRETLPPPSFCDQVISAAGGTVVDVKKMLQKFQPEIDGRLFWLPTSYVKSDTKHSTRVKPNFIIEYITRDQICRPQLQDYYRS